MSFGHPSINMTTRLFLLYTWALCVAAMEEAPEGYSCEMVQEGRDNYEPPRVEPKKTPRPKSAKKKKEKKEKKERRGDDSSAGMGRKSSLANFHAQVRREPIPAPSAYRPNTAQ